MGRGNRKTNEAKTNANVATRQKKEPNPLRPRWLAAFEKSVGRKKTEEQLRSEGIENVPVDKLLDCREFERELDPNPMSYHDDLVESIRKHGVADPVIITYNPTTRVAHINEGNHRVLIAHKLGIEKIPTRVYASKTALPPNSGSDICLGGLYVSQDIDDTKEILLASELFEN